MDPNDHFVALQNSVLSRLQANDPKMPVPTAEHGAIAFLSEQLGDLQNKLARALGPFANGAGGGIAALVRTPVALLIDPTSPTLGMLSPVLVQIQENGLINQGNTGTRIPALRLVSFVMRRLQGWSHNIYDADPGTQRLRLDPKPFVLIRDDGPLTYNVAATAVIDLDAPLRS